MPTDLPDPPDDATLDRLRAACCHPPGQPDADELRRAAEMVAAFAVDDFAQLALHDVGRSAARAEMEALLREPLPEEGIGVDRALRELRDRVVPHALRPTHPRFLAFVPAAPSFASVLGDWLCGATNLFGSVWKEGAGPAQVELLVLDWFREIVGYPAGAGGILTGGGSEAILTALVAARGWLTFEDRSRAVLYASDQRHWSVDRAAMVVGLRPDQVHLVPADADFRLPLDGLRRAADEDRRAGRRPWLVFASAGTTNTGAVDPLADLADFCTERGLWLHADAAYGWAAALTPEGRALLAGIDRADSISLDPHKWFAQTYDVGCLLVRRAAALAETFALRPEYLQDVRPGASEINFADCGIALTRRCRALKIWFSVKALGAGWFRRLVEHSLSLAALAEGLLRRAGGFEVVRPRQLSVVCFRYVPPAGAADLDGLNVALAAAATATGRVFLATTRLGGVAALRLCFVNWRTTAADVEEVVALLQQLGQQLAAGKG